MGFCSSSVAGRAGTDDQAGQLARSYSIEGPQTLAAVAEKRVTKKRGDTLQSRKLPHTGKKPGRKARPADPHDGLVPPFTIGRLLGLEGSQSLGFVEDEARVDELSDNPARKPIRSAPRRSLKILLTILN
jgi:hypothetical protein